MFKNKLSRTAALHITRHAATQAQVRGVDLGRAARDIERVVSEYFGMDTLPDGDYQGPWGRVVVAGGKAVTATETRTQGRFRTDSYSR